MELQRNFPGIGALIALLVTLDIPVADAAPGRTAGFASVSHDGEATYAIPIDLPSGTNGLTPLLSLDYRHRMRGGLLGVGWSLGGLSRRMASPNRRANSLKIASASMANA